MYTLRAVTNVHVLAGLSKSGGDITAAEQCLHAIFLLSWPLELSRMVIFDLVTSQVESQHGRALHSALTS